MSIYTYIHTSIRLTFANEVFPPQPVAATGAVGESTAAVIFEDSFPFSCKNIPQTICHNESYIHIYNILCHENKSSVRQYEYICRYHNLVNELSSNGKNESSPRTFQHPQLYTTSRNHLKYDIWFILQSICSLCKP